MRRIPMFLLVPALAPFVIAGSASAATMTLKEALETAYMTNPKLEAARAGLRAIDEDVAKAHAGWRPNVSVSGYYGTQHIITDEPASSSLNRDLANATATLSEPLFRGGRTVADIGRAKALVRAGQAQLSSVEQGVLLEGAAAYLDVVRDTANFEYRRANVRALEDQLNATNTQVRSGAVTQTDVAQAQARLAAARAGASVAEGQLAASRARFERVIGRPAETLEVMPGLPPLPASLDDAVSVASGRAPTLIAARENSRASDYAVDSAVGALLPQISLLLQYQYGKNSTTLGILAPPNISQRETAVFVQMTLPIYQGGAEHAAVRQAKEQRSQALANVTDTDRQVREGAQSAWGNFMGARASIESNAMAVQANERALSGVQTEQKAGERAILDVLNAEQELLSAQVALATAEHDAGVAAFQLLNATGQMGARDLNLNVKLYDPQAHYNAHSAAWLGLSAWNPR